jgi:RHS repeat-associated protein
MIEYSLFIKTASMQRVNGVDLVSTYNITYGPDDQRRKSHYYTAAGYSTTTIYSGLFEERSNGDRLYHISSPVGIAALVVTNKHNASKRDIYYLYSDYQGSLIAVQKKGSTVLEQMSYDPWGRRRSGTNWLDYKNTSTPFTSLYKRGYTGHEHIDAFGLINMNGRMYDARLGRFLSPDPFVQAPDYSQSFNRYSYCVNNPMKFTDPTGEFWHLVIGAAIGGTVNLIANWKKNDGNFWKGLGYFGVGAAAGALGAGVGAGVNVAMAGGSFGAGFMGTAIGVSSTGFIAGAATGAASGFAGGFVTNSGNAWMGGASFGEGLWSGVKGGGIGALAGGVLGGTIGGIDALAKGTNFWTGKASFDLSNAYGSSGPVVGDKTVTGKYVGKFEGVNLYEAPIPEGSAATLPGRGIILSKGQFTLNGSSRYTKELLQHEFGHILQARMVGLKAFYNVIAPESFISASLDGVGGWSHNTFWTETWANYLSNNYFGVNSFLLNNPAWPAQNISNFNLVRLILP